MLWPMTAAAVQEEPARRVLAQLVAHDYAAVHARFSPTLLKAVPQPEKLGQIWQQFAGHLGAFVRVEKADVGRSGEFQVTQFACVFEKGALNVRLAFDTAGLVAGLFFPPVAVPWSMPPYATADRFDERELTVGKAAFPLKAKLTVPRGPGPFPAVVLVHGSGSSDEDESVGPQKPFRDLAVGLSSRGVVVLRYQKRTFAHPSAFAGRFTVREETTDDAGTAIAVLGKEPKVDPKRIFVLGHSLGGMLAPRLAVAHPRLAGVAILAGTTRPLEDVVLEQMKARGTPADIAAAEASQRRIRDPQLTDADLVEFLGQKVPAGYFLDLRGYQPAQVAAKLEMPILVLQGGRDIQVRTIDYEGWHHALSTRPRAQLKLYPTLTHLFSEGDGTLADYQRPAHVAATVIEDLAAFFTKR